MDDNFNPRCHIGETHGIYTIIDMLDKKDKYGHWIYKCICNKCGHIKFSHYGAISGEKSKTTICRHTITVGKYTTSTCKWMFKRIGNIFYKMLQRCYDTDGKDYKWYGEKGIKICDDWLKYPLNFEKWSIKNGYNDNLTIDRIDSNGDYCPENCQWIPLDENSRKAGMVNWITIDEETLTGRQWAKRLGLGELTIDKFIRKYGLDKTIELIRAMIEDLPCTKHRKSHQTWFDVYNIPT